MNMKKSIIALGAALLIGLSGCGKQTQINVEQAGMLTTAATSSDKFAGVVVSDNAVEITRDSDKQISELYVAVGDTVRVNEKLFEYDTDTLSLTIDKQQLEMDKLTRQITDLNTQIKNLEKQIKDLDSKIKKEKDKKVKAEYENQRSTLDLQLRSVKADHTQATYDKQSLQAEITYNKNMLKNAVVRSPIKGTVRAINENGTPYITIQQAGAFQVKGTLNELSLNAGIMEGVGVTILSRVDPTQFWTGVVTLVDYNAGSSNEQEGMYGGMNDGMSTATSYPFYITLDNTNGLLLGQHVYIQISAAAIGDDLLRIPEGYVMDIVMDEETWLTTGTVWAVNMETGTLTKTSVTLGEYDPTYGTYVILDGITAESYLADPAEAGVKEGAAVHMLGELEYMGQTEPVPTTEPTGETGESGEIGEIVEPVPPEIPAESDGGNLEFEVEVSPTEGGQQDAPLNIGTGSLVFPTEDPEKQ
ncbi:MAG: efflux RND transporter periplasmic adaptor subunit [Oscillospiraceae bacterium]|nr:efflux RND transporter periplasmic adaptor subunit [Oscillospiraceae bacterium]